LWKASFPKSNRNKIFFQYTIGKAFQYYFQFETFLDCMTRRKIYLKYSQKIVIPEKRSLLKTCYAVLALETPWTPCSQNCFDMVFWNIFKKKDHFKVNVNQHLSIGILKVKQMQDQGFMFNQLVSLCKD